MQHATPINRGGWSLSRFLPLFLIMLGALAAFAPSAYAQPLCGSYTIGGSSPNYLTIEDAITDLNAKGVSCAVSFLIRGGTYVPPATGYRLVPVTGMSATNTVTFRPDVGATVTISGTTNNGTGVFDVDNGDYFIIDGSNSAGGTTRNMTIIQGNTSYGASLMVRNDADYNQLKNTIIMSNHGSVALDLVLGGVTIFIVPNQAPALGANGNDSNLIQNNQVGDVNGSIRSHRAIYSYGGSAAAPNIGTKVIGNDVVNFGNTQGNAMGIFISYFNNGAIVRGNTVRMTSAPSGTTAAYGIYVNESLGNGFNPTIEGNRVYGLRAASTGSETIVGILFACNSNNNNSTAKFINNMVSIDPGTATTTSYWMQMLLAPSNVSLLIANNSFYQGGTTGTAFGVYVSQDGSSTITVKNNAGHSTFSGTNYMIYNYHATTTAGWTSTNNVWEYPTGATSYMATFGAFSYTTLPVFQSNTGHDANSVTGNPRFINPSTGDLHVSTTLPTPVESRGTPIAGITTDFDGQLRNATTPDAGADEGNFNGGGIRVVSPNGGESYLAATSMSSSFTITRSMTVSFQLSLDNGATYTNYGTFALTPATWTASFTAPDTVTNRARIRVINVNNPIEGDTSDASFSIVRPTITVIAPNGGEKFYEGETRPIQWRSTDIPADKRVMIEFSSNGGSTWQQIVTNLPSLNTPSVNTYNWTVPTLRTDLARVRISITDRPIVNDQSDGNFQILKTMNLLSPNGGEQWFVGDRKMITWEVANTNYLNIDYSIDNGATWKEVAIGVPAFLNGLEWVVPDMPTTQALVRIYNRERPGQQAQSAATFTILRSELTLTSPNGGEKYDLDEPIQVTWTSLNTTTVRLEYSPDNGNTWSVVSPAIPASAGTFTFTPPAIPTRVGLVRLVNVERTRVRDMSNAPFEIMEEPSITIFTPVGGDRLLAGSKTNIAWEANRITAVDIYFSSNAGATWTLIAGNQNAVLGLYSWTVPTQTTTQGKIRIQQRGGTILSETGIFSIVEPGTPTLRVTTPNGGEKYTEGDPITIRWNQTDLGFVSIYYSSDNGTTWTRIVANTPAAAATYAWTAPAAPGTGYRIKVESTNPAISDQSDASFEVARRLVPSLTLTSPNGGERFPVDTTITVTWEAVDIPGNVIVSFSLDNGATWLQHEIVPASAEEVAWTVPADTSSRVLVKVSDGATAEDLSDAVFTIYRPIVPKITVITPNVGTTVWTERDTVEIEWSSVGVDNVHIEYSRDNGTSWTTVAQTVPSPDAPLNIYQWIVPRISETPISGAVLVRISRQGALTPSDTSDVPFGFQPLTSRVTPGAAETGLTIMKLSGNFPNPFSVSTEVRWSQRVAGTVTLRLHDADGRIVRQVDLGHRISGDHVTAIQAEGLPSGSYHYELVCQGSSLRGVMTIVR